jgi:hypothetical protein
MVNLMALSRNVVVHAEKLKVVIDAARQCGSFDCEVEETKALYFFFRKCVEMLWLPVLRHSLVPWKFMDHSPWAFSRNNMLLGVMFRKLSVLRKFIKKKSMKFILFRFSETLIPALNVYLFDGQEYNSPGLKNLFKRIFTRTKDTTYKTILYSLGIQGKFAKLKMPTITEMNDWMKKNDVTDEPSSESEEENDDVDRLDNSSDEESDDEEGTIDDEESEEEPEESE